MMDKLSGIEQFILAQAIYSRLGEAVSTKDAKSARKLIDAEYRRLWEHTGAKTFTLKFRGENVGTYCVSETRETPPTQVVAYDLADPSAFDGWLGTEDGMKLLADYAMREPEAFVRFVVEGTGELPDGVSPRTVTKDGERGGRYKGSSIRGLDAKRVISLAPEGAMERLLESPTAIAALVAGDSDA